MILPTVMNLPSYTTMAVAKICSSFAVLEELIQRALRNRRVIRAGGGEHHENEDE